LIVSDDHNPKKEKEPTMKRYVEKLPVRHRAQRSPCYRRAVARQRISFQAKAGEALTKTRIEPLLAGFLVALLTSGVLPRPGLAATPTTEMASLTQSGLPGNGNSRFAAISGNGRWVVFQSGSDNLVPGDSNGFFDVFVRDRVIGTTERVSVGQAFFQANGHSDSGVISDDGHIVAFRSSAFNLTGGESNPFSDIFVRDRLNGTTERVSAPQVDTGIDGDSLGLALSADGRFVAFDSKASNLVPGDTNDRSDIFIRDRLFGTTQRVINQAVGGTFGSSNPAISADGRYVAFQSDATNLQLQDTNDKFDIFVRDRVNGTTEVISVGQGGLANGHSTSPAISGNGRYVAFASEASNLVSGDTNGRRDIFVRDRITGTTERVSVTTFGAQGNGNSFIPDLRPAISADGRYVAFTSEASNLVVGDTNGTLDIFVHDRALGTTERVSVSQSGRQANDQSGSFSRAISADGRFVVFHSLANNLVSGDSGRQDVFVRDRGTVADVQLSVADAQVREGSAATLPGQFVQFSSLVFTVSLSARSQQDVSFRYWTEDLVASDRSDYLIRFGTATIPAGSISTVISVPVIQDFDAEPNETMRLNIDVPVNASIARGQAVGTILNDDSSLTFISGTFELSPAEATVAVGDRLTYELTWTVPSDSWRDLNTIEVRIGEEGSLLWLLFDETSRTFSLYNPAKGDFGPAFSPGSHNVLSSGAAKVYLDESAIIAAGPNSPEVTLLLTVGFEPPAIGDHYLVEVGATSDDGQIQAFEPGGSLNVMPRQK
jgi:Tol biopolymer transport system component